MSETNTEHRAPTMVRENIETVVRMENAALERRSAADRTADAIATFTGTIGFVLLHVVWFGLWAAANLGFIPGFKPFDPYPFQLLCMIVSLEGVLLATFVLIKQNRMGYLSERRSHLDLQINLLSEKELTRLHRLTDLIAKRLQLSLKDEATAELAAETEVEELIEALDQRLSSEK
jgi:uncharacterized membrane protein